MKLIHRILENDDAMVGILAAVIFIGGLCLGACSPRIVCRRSLVSADGTGTYHLRARADLADKHDMVKVMLAPNYPEIERPKVEPFAWAPRPDPFLGLGISPRGGRSAR